jgi:hypothetical protein
MKPGEPGVRVVVGAFFPPMDGTEPYDVVLLVHPRGAAARRDAKPLDERLSDREDPLLRLRRGWCDSPQLVKPWVINFT